MKSEADSLGVRAYPFHEAHLQCMEVPDWYITSLGSMAGALPLLLPQLETYTLVYQGSVLAVVGVEQKWDGVMEVFIVPTTYTHRHRSVLAKSIGKTLDLVRFRSKIHRFQTHSLAHPVVDRFMKSIGFLREGTCKMYSSNGLDYNMWAKVWDSAERVT